LTENIGKKEKENHQMDCLYNELDDNNNGLGYVTKIILQEARLEVRLVTQLLITMLSAYSKNPINLLINAPSGVGKNYVINKVASLFPKNDILALAGMTEKALFHRHGILVRKNEATGEYDSIESKLIDIEDEINEKQSQLSQTKDPTQKQELKNVIKEIEANKKFLLKDAKKLINLENKIIVFLDTPPERLIAGLLPLLSHDEYEIEYEYVDTHSGIKTRSNILKGWPVVIIAQALDYSNSPRFAEYQRRFITANPTMSKEKYNEAIDLISNKSSVPDLIYQSQIVSDEEKDKARQIIKDLKEQIKVLGSNVKPGKNNVIIPFNDLIVKSIPREKVSDMTRAGRLFTYLLLLPLIYFDKRPRIEAGRNNQNNDSEDILSKQIIPIAVFDDLQKTISLMEYSDGVRPYIVEWYYDVFLNAYEDKEGTPDFKTIKKKNSSKVEEQEEVIIEERIAVTSKDLIQKHKEKHNETLNTQNLLQSYVYPLLNHGYIDKTDSVVDKRANIYFPIMESKKYSNLFYSEEKNKFSQEIKKIVVNPTTFPSKVYILSKIEPILRYYSDKGLYIKIKNNLDEEISLEGLVDQYFGNPYDYFIVEQPHNQEGKISENDRLLLVFLIKKY
jgi:hypothetical protein